MSDKFEELVDAVITATEEAPLCGTTPSTIVEYRYNPTTARAALLTAIRELEERVKLAEGMFDTMHCVVARTCAERCTFDKEHPPTPDEIAYALGLEDAK